MSALADSMTADLPGHEELALVERARAGDADAFGVLAERAWPELVRLARVVLAGAAEAEDVAQDALLAGWRGLAGLRRVSGFQAWLRRIAWRLALRAARRASRLEPLALEPAALGRATSSGVESRLDVERLLCELTPRERAVLFLSEIEGMNAAEIGRELGIAAVTVRVHRWQARRRLAERLGGTS